ncbi:3-oxoacyl-ACP synthase OS=Streptomyces microflavus OX=1919 GN=Smic_25890 PE=3 SV=1 [Streptomyces microflavus]
MTDDIAVTGIGLVTPGGTGTEATWDAVCAGRATARTDPYWRRRVRGCTWPAGYRLRSLGSLSSLREQQGQLWRYDPATRFLLTAAREAVASARLQTGAVGAPRGWRWSWARRAGSPRWRRSTASCWPPVPARSPR